MLLPPVLFLFGQTLQLVASAQQKAGRTAFYAADFRISPPGTLERFQRRHAVEHVGIGDVLARHVSRPAERIALG